MLNFQKYNPAIALNILFAKINKEEIKQVYTSKNVI